LIESVLAGGDDYEILCTVAPEKVQSFLAAAAAVNVPLADIGAISQGEGVRFLDAENKPLALSRLSYSHF
jgi:thiamine-monophosphate kinase